MARLIALIAQADAGDYDALSPSHALYSQCCHIQPMERGEPKPQDFLLRIIQQHKEIKVRTSGRKFIIIRYVIVCINILARILCFSLFL